MKSLNKYYALHGVRTSRTEIEQLISEASNEGQLGVVSTLTKLLANHSDASFLISIANPVINAAPLNGLFGMEQLDYAPADEFVGLGKPVSQAEIYDYCTELIIDTIKNVGHLPWQKEWNSKDAKQPAGVVANYVSKKPYTGINFLLNYDIKEKDGKLVLVPAVFKNPYYITFNQLQDAGGTINKGAKARRVFYYTLIYDYNDGVLEFKTSDQSKFSEFVLANKLTSDQLNRHLVKIPVIKYYNVFKTDDCTGLKFPKQVEQPEPQTEQEKIDLCEEVIQNFPNKPQYKFGGDGAYYMPSSDFIQMPVFESFTEPQFYYSTFFHEMIHSTGHQDRLKRDFTGRMKGSSEQVKKYAFEELIAELGAVFLCAHTGILFRTRDNSAKYLKSWNKRLIEQLEDDNRFIFKASAQAQKAADYILAYEKPATPDLPKVKKARKPKATQKPEPKPEPKPKSTTKTKDRLSNNPEAFSRKPKSISVQTAVADVLSLPKFKGKTSPLVGSILYKTFRDADFSEETAIEVESGYNAAILKKNSPLHVFFETNNEVDLTSLGVDFVNAVKGRVESLRNQKSNYLFFDGLKKPEVANIEVEEAQPQKIELEQQNIAPEYKPNSKVQKIGASAAPAQYLRLNGEVGAFLQRVEKKPKQSVVITMDGEQGAGKTTTLYKFIDAFASAGNKSVFFSLEEHPQSSLAIEKAQKYLSQEAINNTDIIGELDSATEFYDYVSQYDVIFIDSWQKLLRAIGTIMLDEDLRKRFDGKVFVIIFQQTTTGRTKGGAEVVFDGDIIIKMVKAASFANNYAYFDKHRYTLVPTEDIRYNIASGTTYNPNQKTDEPANDQPINAEGFSFQV